MLLILFVLSRLHPRGSSFLEDRTVYVPVCTFHAFVTIPQGSSCWALVRGLVMAMRGSYSNLSACTGHGPVLIHTISVFLLSVEKPSVVEVK